MHVNYHLVGMLLLLLFAVASPIALTTAEQTEECAWDNAATTNTHLLGMSALVLGGTGAVGE